jgi:hypothetical protein
MRSVAGPRFARVLVGSLLLGAPFVIAAQLASGLVAPLTSTIVAALVRVTAPVTVLPAPEPEADELDPVAAAPLELSFEVATKSPAQRVAKARPPAKPSALFVSEATVLRLAQSAARPRGSFVAQSPEHPAGLRLSGVAALGIGVQDGDILIEALGITPRAPGQIIGAIIEARAKQARFLSGTLWRQGQTFAITVEQPYLQPEQREGINRKAGRREDFQGGRPADTGREG